MSRFQNIDDLLEDTARKLSARLTKDRPCYPEALRTFEERRIDWEKDGINLAIIIQPTFELKGVDSERWNYINIAWKSEKKGKRRFMHQPVERKAFGEIENQIETLLVNSVELLSSITDDQLTRRNHS